MLGHADACLNMQRNNKLGALAFGVELPNGKQAYPTSPSWMLYGGDDAHCMDNVPVLIRPETFCSVFTAEARVFRQDLSCVHIVVISRCCCVCSSPKISRYLATCHAADPMIVNDDCLASPAVIIAALHQKAHHLQLCIPFLSSKAAEHQVLGWKKQLVRTYVSCHSPWL